MKNQFLDDNCELLGTNGLEQQRDPAQMLFIQISIQTTFIHFILFIIIIAYFCCSSDAVYLLTAVLYFSSSDMINE